MSSKLPLVSIIIPVYNRQAIFARSLQSACAQDYSNCEVIVVDDGSETEVELPDFAKSRVKLFRQKNQGAPAARNRGFAESTGDFVIFWDADVIAKPNLIKTMLAVLEQNPQASYVYSDFYFGLKKMSAKPFDPLQLRQENYITTTSLLRREAFTGFDECLVKFQDWDLWLTLLSQNKTGVYVSETLFRVLPGGTMSAWLPRFAYQAPWKWLPGIRQRVKQYELARQAIWQKHGQLSA